MNTHIERPSSFKLESHDSNVSKNAIDNAQALSPNAQNQHVSSQSLTQNEGQQHIAQLDTSPTKMCPFDELTFENNSLDTCVKQQQLQNQIENNNDATELESPKTLKKRSPSTKENEEFGHTTLNKMTLHHENYHDSQTKQILATFTSDSDQMNNDSEQKTYENNDNNFQQQIKSPMITNNLNTSQHFSQKQTIEENSLDNTNFNTPDIYNSLNGKKNEPEPILTQSQESNNLSNLQDQIDQSHSSPVLNKNCSPTNENSCVSTRKHSETFINKGGPFSPKSSSLMKQASIFPLNNNTNEVKNFNKSTTDLPSQLNHQLYLQGSSSQAFSANSGLKTISQADQHHQQGIETSLQIQSLSPEMRHAGLKDLQSNLNKKQQSIIQDDGLRHNLTQKIECPFQQTEKKIYVFSTIMANDAAIAVNQNKFHNIIEFHTSLSNSCDYYNNTVSQHQNNNESQGPAGAGHLSTDSITNDMLKNREKKIEKLNTFKNMISSSTLPHAIPQQIHSGKIFQISTSSSTKRGFEPNSDYESLPALQHRQNDTTTNYSNSSLIQQPLYGDYCEEKILSAHKLSDKLEQQIKSTSVTLESNDEKNYKIKTAQSCGINSVSLQTTPSPQLMNYVEFEGQELTITKQLNAGFKTADELIYFPNQNSSNNALNCINNTLSNSATNKLENHLVNDFNQDSNNYFNSQAITNNFKNGMGDSQHNPINGLENKQNHIKQHQHHKKPKHHHGFAQIQQPLNDTSIFSKSASIFLNDGNNDGNSSFGPLNSMLQMTNSIPKSNPYASNSLLKSTAPQLFQPISYQQHSTIDDSNHTIGFNSDGFSQNIQPLLTPNSNSLPNNPEQVSKSSKKHQQKQQKEQRRISSIDAVIPGEKSVSHYLPLRGSLVSHNHPQASMQLLESQQLACDDKQFVNMNQITSTAGLHSQTHGIQHIQNDRFQQSFILNHQDNRSTVFSGSEDQPSNKIMRHNSENSMLNDDICRMHNNSNKLNIQSNKVTNNQEINQQHVQVTHTKGHRKGKNSDGRINFNQSPSNKKNDDLELNSNNSISINNKQMLINHEVKYSLNQFDKISSNPSDHFQPQNCPSHINRSILHPNNSSSIIRQQTFEILQNSHQQQNINNLDDTSIFSNRPLGHHCLTNNGPNNIQSQAIHQHPHDVPLLEQTQQSNICDINHHNGSQAAPQHSAVVQDPLFADLMEPIMFNNQ